MHFSCFTRASYLTRAGLALLALAVSLLAAPVPQTARAQAHAEFTLHTFTGTGSSDKNADGANPLAGLLSDSRGNLFGTTIHGGGWNGNGTVFEITRGGVYSTLHSFTAIDKTGSNADGAYPWAGVITDRSGNLFGTTAGGGANRNGVVFKISSGGVYSLLHTFTEADTNSGKNADGAEPHAGLVIDSRGSLFGTTSRGGANRNGVVFKITTGTNAYSTLHTFTGELGFASGVSANGV